MSMQIKELEDELKVAWSNRRKSGVELTEQGEEIAKRARTILAAVRDLLDYAKHQEGVLAGVLKLGAIPSIAPYLLPAALPELQRRFPGLSRQLRETVTANLVHELVARDLDLIVVALPIDDPDVETFHLFDDRFVLA
jgi:LysR family hydrogen peroxide-inducible transcriptional activator